MNIPGRRLCVILALVVVVFGTWLSGSASAQTSIVGNAVSQSTWDNGTLLSPPGDGSGNGSIVVGVWNSGSQILGPPAYSAVAAGPGGLPFAAGSYGYSIPVNLPGDYQVVAWVDSAGAGAGGYDLGEPRSFAAAVTIVSNSVSGVNVTITDDVDADGLPDWWEVHWFGSLSEVAGSDPDNDSLPNLQEYQISQAYPSLLTLNPASWDTDNDGIDDGWEYSYYANGTGTDPCVSDSSQDADGDGLSNWQEYLGVDGRPFREKDPSKVGKVARTTGSGDDLSPIDIDTDNDGLIDSFEAAWYDPANGINPKSAGDLGADQDEDGLGNYREQCLLAELQDGGADDIWSEGPSSLPVADANGLRSFSTKLVLNSHPLWSIPNTATLAELRWGTNIVAAFRFGNAWTDPSHGSGYLSDLIDDGDGWDTDRDGLPDGWEVEFNLDPKDARGNQGEYGDPDGDSLLNTEEYFGQDGDRASSLPYINGTGDETNPNEHNARPDSTAAGSRISRETTIGSASPTAHLVPSNGLDTDDDGVPDAVEIQQEYEGRGAGTSPVHSMDPFIKRCASITDGAGVPVPTPEGAYENIHARAWTLECHVKITDTNRNGYLIDIPGCPPPSAPQRPFTCRLWLSNAVPVASFYTVAGYLYEVAGLQMPSNTWTHMAATWNPELNSLALYVDGIFVQEQRVYQESVSGKPYGLTNNPTLGRSLDGSFTNGLYLDEVRVWTIARSATEIEEYRTKFVSQTSTGLAAYYRFDDGGTTAEDFARKAKNGLNGTEYSYGDFAYALPTNSCFVFVTNDYANVRGVDRRGADDTDGDGMPDGWELINGLAPLSALGDNGAAGDPDGDGLSNVYEFWSGTNPRAQDTDQNGILDGNEDADGDGVVNLMEQRLGCRPDMIDTDDDDLADGVELANGTSPINPTDPAVARSAQFGGAPGDYFLVPNSLDQRLLDWTLEAWVNPTNAVGGVGTIIQRIVETPQNGTNAINFVLGLEANAGGLRPYAGYQLKSGISYFVRGSNIAVNAWTHLAACYDSANARLVLYTNGVLNASLLSAFNAPPRNGKGGETSLRIGQDFEGLIDDVRIWNDVRATAEILPNFGVTVDGSSQGLINYFRFDDGEYASDPHGAQDFTKTADWSQEWMHAARAFGNARMVIGSVIGVPPSVTVILEPLEARYGGAQWTVDGAAWHDSGDSVVSTPGSHSITYKSLPNWTAPASEMITLSNNQATNITRTYVGNAKLRVVLEPGTVRDAGAGWSLDSGFYYDSDVVVSNLAPGSHTLRYSYVSGWVSPPYETIILDEGADVILTRQYSIISGSVSVHMGPASAVSSGAMWRVDSGTWQTNDAVVSNLGAGSHTIWFNILDGWTSPDPETIYVSDNNTILVSASYMQQGSLTIYFSYSPTNGHPEGAWRLNSDPSYTWHTNQETVSLAPGGYDIIFAEFPAWRIENSWVTYWHNYWYSYYGWAWYGVYVMIGNGEQKVLGSDPTNAVTYVQELDWDNDGLPDWWERKWFGDLEEYGGEDFDSDGLSNREEYDISASFPQLSELNPASWDSDGDGMDDKWEYERFAKGSGLNACSNDIAMDPDNDGLVNWFEYIGADGATRMEQDPDKAVGVGRLNPLDHLDALNPLDVDTDKDGLIDSFEYFWLNVGLGIDPKTSGDPAADPDHDGLSNYREQCLLSELREGGADDIWTRGTNSFPVADTNGLSSFAVQLNLAGIPAWTDPCSADSDHDLLPDGWEVEFSIDPRDATLANGYFGDPDGDGLLNFQEYLGQDGRRSATLPYINGSGDETNPNEHNWRPDSTAVGPGTSRPFVSNEYWNVYDVSPSNGTLGAALPTARVGTPGFDAGTDTDDDGVTDNVEIQQEFDTGMIGSSPVHSMDPFIKRSALIVNDAGIELPDPEGNLVRGYAPLLHGRNWSIECCVKILSAGRSGYLINCPGPFGIGDIAFRLELSNDVPRVSFDTLGLTRYYVEGLPIPTNKWTHLAATWNTDANSLALYVDGIFVTEQRIYEESLSGYLYGSALPPALCVSADGTFANQLYVDEVRIWKLARTPAQIDEFRTKLAPQNSEGLSAYFRFDDGGTGAEDFARKAKNGLAGAVLQDYLFGDFGYALATNRLGINYFVFVTNDYANTRGVDPRGADDSDGDGLPDAWEVINHLDPFSADGENGAQGDPDVDGLNNLYEFWAGTNPRAQDSNRDGVLDSSEDCDGDGVVNVLEQELASRPDMVDTDDDGATDNAEAAGGTNPANPTDPALPRCMEFGGGTVDYLEIPNALQQRLVSWTLEAWAFPSNVATGAGTIISRVVEDTAAGKKINFILGIETNGGVLRPYAGYQFTNGSGFFVRGGTMDIGVWTHVAASYDSQHSRLTLYTNGAVCTYISDAYVAPPINGRGGQTFLRIGEDFAGLLDDVRVWSDVRTAAEIRNNFDRVVDGNSSGLINYFRFDDGQAVTNAQFPAFSEFFQPHGPQDFTWTADWNQEWVHAASINGNVRFASGGMGVPPTVSVTLNPTEARDAGAQWSFDAVSGWLDSGQFIVSEPGTHTIIYKSVDGWTTPDPETISLVNNMTTNLVRTYLRNGGVQVDLEPAMARLNGAQWQVDGSVWQMSGSVFSNLSPGVHTINFGIATNFITPPSQNVTINEGAVTPLIVWYTPILGSVMGVIEPSSVVSNGAQWRIDGGAWTDGGTIISNLTLGDHTVEFLPVLPWLTPSNKVVTIIDQSMMVITGKYTQITGIQVVLSPPDATAAGAQWRIGEGSWQDSGALIAVPAGQYSIGFKTINDWVAPNTINVTVSNDVVSYIQASYYDLDFLGSAGAGAGQLNKPRGLAITDRYLYVADSGNNRIQILDTMTLTWTVLGSYGTRAGQFNQPFGLALDPSGNLWVADAGNHRIQKRNAATGAWTVFGSRGSNVGQFVEPFDVESDSAGNIYVTDHYNNRVQKLSLSGAWSVVVGNGRNNGFVRLPNGLGIDALDNLYVSDYDSVIGLSRVQKFTSAGTFLGVVGMSGGAGGLSMPRGITAGLSTNIYVADTGNRQVQQCVGTGTWSVVLSSMFLSEPHDVAMDILGDLYISDTASNRILRMPNHSPITLSAPYIYGQYSSGQVGVWHLTTGGLYKASSLISAAATPWLVRAAGDIDGNGIADIVWQLPTGQAACWFMNTNASRISVVMLYTGAMAWQIRCSGDIDGDGFDDLIWQLPTGQVAGWLMNPNGTVKSTFTTYNGVTTWQIRGAGDIDGDGVADLILQLPTGQVACWLMKPNGTIKSSLYIYNGATTWVVRCAGDINGDGVADLIWQLPTGQTACWLLNSNGTVKKTVNTYTRPNATTIRGSGR